MMVKSVYKGKQSAIVVLMGIKVAHQIAEDPHPASIRQTIICP